MGRDIEGAARFHQKRAARRGQMHAARSTLEQDRPELALEIANLLGDGWLRDAEPGPSPAEAALLSDSNEVPQVA